MSQQVRCPWCGGLLGVVSETTEARVHQGSFVPVKKGASLVTKCRCKRLCEIELKERQPVRRAS